MLKEQLENEQNKEVREHLNQEVEVITAQRKKGLSILKEIKKAKKKAV